MKTFFISFLLLIGMWQLSIAAESQIILINAEAYLVELDDHYDVEKIHMKVPNYFSSPETHEVLLAYYVDNLHRDTRLSSVEELSDEAEEVAEAQTIREEVSETCSLVTECNSNSIAPGYYSIPTFHSTSDFSYPTKFFSSSINIAHEDHRERVPYSYLNCHRSLFLRSRIVTFRPYSIFT